jgi:hypothetical protein
MQSTNLLANHLEMVLEGRITLEEILKFEPALAHCLHRLQHFLADEDIRRKDHTYRSMQESEVRKLIRLLRSNADSSALSAISFLGRSDV